MIFHGAASRGRRSKCPSPRDGRGPGRLPRGTTCSCPSARSERAGNPNLRRMTLSTHISVDRIEGTRTGAGRTSSGSGPMRRTVAGSRRSGAGSCGSSPLRAHLQALDRPVGRTGWRHPGRLASAPTRGFSASACPRGSSWGTRLPRMTRSRWRRAAGGSRWRFLPRPGRGRSAAGGAQRQWSALGVAWGAAATALPGSSPGVNC